MINYTDGKLDEALKFAREHNDSSLQKCLNRLGSRETDLLVISNDFAPYSFLFGCYDIDKEGDRIIKDVKCRLTLNGGIIFHGKHDGGGNGSSPTYSVCIESANGWKIHT